MAANPYQTSFDFGPDDPANLRQGKISPAETAKRIYNTNRAKPPGLLRRGLGVGARVAPYWLPAAGLEAMRRGFDTGTDEYRRRFGYGEVQGDGLDAFANDLAVRTMGVGGDFLNAASLGLIPNDLGMGPAKQPALRPKKGEATAGVAKPSPGAVPEGGPVGTIVTNNAPGTPAAAEQGRVTYTGTPEQATATAAADNAAKERLRGNNDWRQHQAAATDSAVRSLERMRELRKFNNPNYDADGNRKPGADADPNRLTYDQRLAIRNAGVGLRAGTKKHMLKGEREALLQQYANDMAAAGLTPGGKQLNPVASSAALRGKASSKTDSSDSGKPKSFADIMRLMTYQSGQEDKAYRRNRDAMGDKQKAEERMVAEQEALLNPEKPAAQAAAQRSADLRMVDNPLQPGNELNLVANANEVVDALNAERGLLDEGYDFIAAGANKLFGEGTMERSPAVAPVMSTEDALKFYNQLNPNGQNAWGNLRGARVLRGPNGNYAYMNDPGSARQLAEIRRIQEQLRRNTSQR